MGALLEVRGLTKRFPRRQRRSLTAVAEVDLDLKVGETFGVVGESGCGKTTLARCIVRLEQPTAGTITLAGVDITELSAAALRPHRRRMQILFQDPTRSLNPRRTVRSMLSEPLRVHRVVPRAEIEARSVQLLEQVGLSADQLDRYPHEFSAGQRQRLGIARALSVTPELIIADEPVSSLDAPVRAQVVNLLTDLRVAFGLAFLFITHDLRLIRQVSDRVAVMFLGRIVETGPTDAVYAAPAHPYTRALHAATPLLYGTNEDISAGPDLWAPIELATGCPYLARCPIAHERCRAERPALRPVGEEHSAACHLATVTPPTEQV